MVGTEAQSCLLRPLSVAPRHPAPAAGLRSGPRDLGARECGSEWIWVGSGWRAGRGRSAPDRPHRPTDGETSSHDASAAHTLPRALAIQRQPRTQGLPSPDTPLRGPPSPHPPRPAPHLSRGSSLGAREHPPSKPEGPSSLTPLPPPPLLPAPHSSLSSPPPPRSLAPTARHLLQTATCQPDPAVRPPATPLPNTPAPAPPPVPRRSPPASSLPSPSPSRAPLPRSPPRLFLSPPRQVSGLSVCQSFGQSAPQLRAAGAIASRAGQGRRPGRGVSAAAGRPGPPPARQVRAVEAPGGSARFPCHTGAQSLPAPRR